MISLNPKDEIEFMENFHCQPDKPFVPTETKLANLVSPQNYQPETVSIPKLEVENIIDALQTGLEHTESVLIEHDASLGRTTGKNELWAKQLEKDIEFFKTRIKLLKEKLVGATTHYP